MEMQLIAVAIGIAAGVLVLIPLLLGLWFLWLIRELRDELRRIADTAELLLERIETRARERNQETDEWPQPVDR